MDTDDLEVIRAAVLKLTPTERAALAERSGVPESTLSKFAHGHVQVPLYTTVQAVKAVLYAPQEPAAAA